MNDIYDVDCDIYAPCALGATLMMRRLIDLSVRLSQAANNQLKEPKHGDILKQKNILTLPITLSTLVD